MKNPAATSERDKTIPFDTCALAFGEQARVSAIGGRGGTEDALETVKRGGQARARRHDEDRATPLVPDLLCDPPERQVRETAPAVCPVTIRSIASARTTVAMPAAARPLQG